MIILLFLGFFLVVVLGFTATSFDPVVIMIIIFGAIGLQIGLNRKKEEEAKEEAARQKKQKEVDAMEAADHIHRTNLAYEKKYGKVE